MRIATRVFASSSFSGSHNKTHKKAVLEPRTARQRDYVEKLRDPGVDVVVASGVAGSGKTLFATYTGMRMLTEGHVKKLILTRPAVCTEESHGFLPGTLDKKMEPWTRPLFDVIETQFKQDDIQKMLSNRVIEVSPIAFMRGRTFENAWIVLDEAQNCTPNQMLMVLTRLGTNSKLVITGDPSQHDRGFDINGLTDLIGRINGVDGKKDSRIQVIQLEDSDVQRHHLIPYILSLYE